LERTLSPLHNHHQVALEQCAGLATRRAYRHRAEEV
jgi:hypothetical protein